jgi:DNA-directed RNA polymerase
MLHAIQSAQTLVWNVTIPVDPQLSTFAAQIAKEFRDEQALYFPHNLDFRGRAYPMHGNLNHLGSDVSRGILQFAEARPLGERGLYWLHVQVRHIMCSDLSLRRQRHWVQL